jgi:3-hydroxybutyryl-CoA dehydrogenase
MERIERNGPKSLPVRPVRHRWPSETQVGVVGLGLMGRSIVACLLGAGHPVVGFDADRAKSRQAARSVQAFLQQMRKERLLRTSPTTVFARFHLSSDYQGFENCAAVIEAVTEDQDVKKRVLQSTELAVPGNCLIASNTSGIPISSLQESAIRPERIVGMHWAEPAHVTRFMEVVAGRLTSPAYARMAVKLARQWGKEPSLVRRDVRGFITNRISYAMFREACHLVDTGVATVADVDRSLRNDLGYYILFAGAFRLMDLMGIPAYAAVMRDLLPDLNCDARVPRLMGKMIRAGARGVSNCKGFYQYTPARARHWKKLFVEFNYDIRRLAMKYPEDVGDRPRSTQKTPARVP